MPAMMNTKIKTSMYSLGKSSIRLIKEVLVSRLGPPLCVGDGLVPVLAVCFITDCSEPLAGFSRLSGSLALGAVDLSLLSIGRAIPNISFKSQKRKGFVDSEARLVKLKQWQKNYQ